MRPLRFFLFFLFAFVPAALFPQEDFRRLSDAEAAEVLDGFRSFRMAGDFCMKFGITHHLRKSDESEFCAGTLYGSWDSAGPVMRIDIARAANPESKKSFLLRGGREPELWTLDAEGKPTRADGNAAEPFFDGLIFTPFDLQTPFVYWNDAKYEKTKRYRGRPVHFFKMTPPEEFRALVPEIGFVRAGLDRVYNALVSVEAFGSDGKLKRTFSLSRVQKVQEQYTIRKLELRDEATRDKDELVVFSAAMNLLFPRSAFSPEALAEPPPSVPASRFSRL